MQNDNSQVFIGFISILFVLWLSLYAVAYMVGRGPWFISQTKKFFTSIWRKHRTQIVWACVGFVLGALACSPR